MTLPETGRDRIVDFLRSELIGPAGGPQELVEREKPNMRYVMGVLFPPETGGADVAEDFAAEEEVEGPEPAPPDENRADDPVTLSGQWMPASMGLSFFFTGATFLDIELWGARYEANESGDWARTPIAEREAPETHTVTAPSGGGRTEVPVLEGRARLHVLWRPLNRGQRRGYLVTVTLVNASERESKKSPDASDCLYQVGFRCQVPEGSLEQYPAVDRVLSDEEEQELDLLYRHKKKFGVGHGCAAAWNEPEVPTTIETEFLPRAVVPAMTHDLAGDDEEKPRALEIAFLADSEVAPNDLGHELDAFLDRYERWIGALPGELPGVPKRLLPAGNRLLNRLRETLARMRGGVERLRTDGVALEAFRLANEAMLMQMHHGGEELAGSRWSRNKAPLLPEDYAYLEHKRFSWRPFQLAFQLLTIEGLADYDSRERELADLIWFPTGGGKTEAYLAVAAFEIFRRRLVHGSAGAGTAVITRYTLRLLTSQQFQRASRLICACEILRRQRPEVLGDAPITIGFWAGQATSPNTYQQAVEKRAAMLEAGGDNPFQIERCPWCGTELKPERMSEDEAAYGFRADNASFEIFCPTGACAFHARLPVSVVDQDLYEHPPTFLIGTIDKFARLAWERGGGAFFGVGGNLPPTLVIQDELHLLSGPLGTTAAVYEAALHELMRNGDARPKIVASTATIRSASDQVKALFDREVRLFPPAGLDAEDSFFARVDHEKPGRLYVGVMSPHHRPSTSLIRTASGLLQAPEEVPLAEKEDDVYRTLVVYHLSLRELGKTSAYARDDVPARLELIAPDGRMRTLSDHRVVELTSNTPSYQIPEILERLAKSPGDDGAVDILVCTNMISVGVDVPRLGLMVLHGQPKTTSEYIQASSRVGRSEVPGLVVAHYSANKPRDRSHYEDFVAYHNAIYRYVEPTSVTPFSSPSRDRSLHAALVLLVRHGCGLSENEAVSRFRKDMPCIQQAVESLLRVVDRVEPDESSSTRVHLMKRVDEWHRLATTYPQTLRYDSYWKGEQFRTLLKPFGKDGDGWPTLNSMRNVDGEAPVRVVGADYS